MTGRHGVVNDDDDKSLYDKIDDKVDDNEYNGDEMNREVDERDQFYC